MKKTISLLVFLLVFLNTSLLALNQEGSLTVKVIGFENNKGQLILQVFREKDDIFEDKPYKKLESKIDKQQTEITFENLPYGSYSIMAIHDEDNNGVMNHNIMRLPTESFGFSNSWNLSIFSGKPTFEKTSFLFSEKNSTLKIMIK
jgi:uncharacterized protein (DUF2141 family)